MVVLKLTKIKNILFHVIMDLNFFINFGNEDIIGVDITIYVLE